MHNMFRQCNLSGNLECVWSLVLFWLYSWMVEGIVVLSILAQLAFTCWKSTCEICSKVKIKHTRTMSLALPLTLLWCFYCELWTYFTSFPSVSSVDLNQVNVSWVSTPDAVLYSMQITFCIVVFDKSMHSKEHYWKIK